jgi:hypothetical protein
MASPSRPISWPERGGGSGARRRAGTRLCRGGVRGAQLAQRSASAAKEIKSLITDSVAQVEAGSKLVQQAGKTMDEVVASVKKVSDIVAEITSAGQEQKSASSRSTRPSPRWTR